MTQAHKRALAAACLLPLALAACGGGDGGPEVADTPTAEESGADETTTTEPEGQDASEAAEEYFTLLGENNLATINGMLELATLGSPAYLYAQHQIAGTRGFGSQATTVEVGDDSIESCAEYLNSAGQDEQTCYTYTDFTANSETGLLETLSVNGLAVAERIRAGDPAGVSEQGVTVKVVTAYQTALGDVIINLDVTNSLTTPITIADYEFQYVDPTGRQFAPSQDFYSQLPTEIQPGATAPVLAAFSQAPFGGAMTFVGFTNEFATEIHVEVPVAP